MSNLRLCMALLIKETVQIITEVAYLSILKQWEVYFLNVCNPIKQHHSHTLLPHIRMDTDKVIIKIIIRDPWLIIITTIIPYPSLDRILHKLIKITIHLQLVKLKGKLISSLTQINKYFLF